MILDKKKFKLHSLKQNKIENKLKIKLKLKLKMIIKKEI